jgi:hypothetical protein
MSTMTAANKISVSDVLALSVPEISEHMKRESERSSHGYYTLELTQDVANLDAAQQDAVDEKLR